MVKYRPVFPSRYGSRYVLDAPSEFQQRIKQIDPVVDGMDPPTMGFESLNFDFGDFLGGVSGGAGTLGHGLYDGFEGAYLMYKAANYIKQRRKKQQDAMWDEVKEKIWPGLDLVFD